MTITLDSRKDFTLANYARVAAGEGVAFSDGARQRMSDERARFIALLDSDRSQFIYGTTSGGGPDAKNAIPADEQRKRSAWKPESATGAGFGGEPLPESVVRGIVFARLANYVEGHAKSRPVMAERVAALLDEPMAEVPSGGQVGPGEVLPLAFVTARLWGDDLEEGEPMALINGSPVSAALAADTALLATPRLALAEEVFALSVEAFNAPLDAYDPALDDLWGDPFEGRALVSLRRLLTGVSTEGRRPYQAPVGWRILPRVLGQAWRAVDGVTRAAEVSLASVTDNPVLVPADHDHPHGRALSNGGYHNAMATPALDTLSQSWADLASLADRQTTKMHAGPTSLLPAMLKPAGSPGFGTAILAMAAIGFVEDARHAAQRTLLPGSEGGGFGQNDVASPTMQAWRKERQAAAALEATLACLAIAASQALAVTGRTAPPALDSLVSLVRRHFPPVAAATEGRRFGPEAAALTAAFRDRIAGPAGTSAES
ncbi:MAG: aromatic amino acid lyase [Alphaproteobacteria bacterium]